MGVIYLSPRDDAFEGLYLSVREKEHRIFTDAQVSALPNLEKTHPLHNEWQLRKKSAMRFIGYLKNKERRLKILDIGCGNGWFSNLMADVKQTDVTGIDINRSELEQASAIFRKPNLTFVYANLFENTDLRTQRFDVILFNSCFQYFKNVSELLTVVSAMLADGGEIHIIDTPFYTLEQLQDAKARTAAYYKNLGFPEMASQYFHRVWDELPAHKICYKPSLFAKLLGNDSPFCWISIDTL